MDPSIQKALLQDPAVQEAIKKAGQDALANPEVQQKILETCKEKFPEAALAAKDKIMEWANDPEVQKQAYHYAGVAIGAAWKSVEQVAGLIEQGPAGVRILAFAGGLASVGNAVLQVVLSPLAIVSNITHLYQLLFALTTMLFEAKPEWIEYVSGLNEYQKLLIDKAKFLSEVLGRGLFYGFQGVIWLYFSSATELISFGVGCWFLFMAFLHICMHFGIMPQEVAKKMQSVRTMISHDGSRVSPREQALKPEEAKHQADVEQGGVGGFFSSLLGREEKTPEPEPPAPAPPAVEEPKPEPKAAAKPPEREPLLGAAAVAPKPAAGPKPGSKACCCVQ